MRHAAATTIALAASVGIAAAAPRLAWAQDPAPGEVPAATASPAQLLAAADAAVDAGNLDAAAALYDQLAREHPASQQANEARRALKIIAARRLPPPVRPDEPPPSGDGTVGVVIRREPFSLRTQERLRLTTWEKLDFGVTSFLYGMSVGLSYALSLRNSSESAAFGPIAIGALAYTLGSVAYLKLGEPDRGDLPLALAITSFIPTTTLLVANVAAENPDERSVALATTSVGLLSVPLAILAARTFDPDPGDMQLVRDAGFWGLVLGTTGALAFGGKTVDSGFGFTSYQEPSNRKIFTFSLLGLYGGLGLGTVAALNSEVSLERVRVTTWGGYGGAVIGLLIGGAAADSDEGLWKGITIGALAGLVITFIATFGLDGIPPEDVAARAPRRPQHRFAPTLVPVTGVDGRQRTGLGITGLLF
jgi:hypothetical protein